MVNLDLFSYLKYKIASGDKVDLSMSEILEETKLTKKVIVTKLKNLESEGYIEVIRNKTPKGASLPNTYILKMEPKLTPNVHADLSQKIRVIYCYFVSKRIGDTLNPKFAFQGFSNQFLAIAEIVVAENLNPHMYISSCFYTFKEKWCRDKFNLPYPPPYIVASKKNAYERYNSYMRYLNGNTIGDVKDKSMQEKLVQDLYTWRQTGAIEDEDFLKLLIENETISPIFAVSLPFVSEDFANSVSSNFSSKDVQYSKKILKKLLKEEKVNA